MSEKKAVSAEAGMRRLLKLADFLETVPSKRFDYARWVGDDWGGKQDLSCGTTACAMGWGATMPAFRRLGVRISGIGRGGYPSLDAEGITGLSDVAERVFGMSYNEYRYLFVPGREEMDATPKQVAKKIRRFVEDKREHPGACRR